MQSDSQFRDLYSTFISILLDLKLVSICLDAAYEWCMLTRTVNEAAWFTKWDCLGSSFYFHFEITKFWSWFQWILALVMELSIKGQLPHAYFCLLGLKGLIGVAMELQVALFLTEFFRWLSLNFWINLVNLNSSCFECKYVFSKVALSFLMLDSNMCIGAVISDVK